MPPPIIYINGYPGVGKLTVAKELSKMITGSKVISNHHLIDPVSMVFDRSMPEYQPLRRAVRRAILDAIATSVSTNDVTWICTDQRPSSGMGSSAAKDYLQAAQSRGSRFISIILTCEAAENERRLRSADRGGPNNTKLTDIGILREIRESEDLYHFGGQDELELDVSAMSASETAKAIFDFVGKRIRLPDLA